MVSLWNLIKLLVITIHGFMLVYLEYNVMRADRMLNIFKKKNVILSTIYNAKLLTIINSVYVVLFPKNIPELKSDLKRSKAVKYIFSFSKNYNTNYVVRCCQWRWFQYIVLENIWRHAMISKWLTDTVTLDTNSNIDQEALMFVTKISVCSEKSTSCRKRTDTLR